VCSWQICPICTDDEGAFVMSDNMDISGQWFSMPADIQEKYVEIRFVTEVGNVIEPEDCERALVYEYDDTQERDAMEPEPEPEVVDEHAIPFGMAVDKTSIETEEGNALSQLLGWDESNHACMLFNNLAHSVQFLSRDAKRMRDEMHPNLLMQLEQNNINVGSPLEDLNSKFVEILGMLTGKQRSKAEAGQLMKGDYAITGDNLLKMLAIYVRVRCGVPVVLSGECGCGKTYLISFICAWLGSPLLNLDVHGGTTEEDIVDTFERARQMVRDVDECFVFLDECNTCAHMGLITEVIVNRTVNQVPLPSGVKVLAAINPYRRRPASEQSPGLVFQLGAQTTPDPMAQLVYRVHPVPRSLHDFIFDFGALQHNTETLYIQSMVRKSLTSTAATAHDCTAIAALISGAQRFTRTTVGDASAASLRDAKRCLSLLLWFQSTIDSRTKESGNQTEQTAGRGSLGVCSALALAMTYYYRHGSTDARAGFWRALDWALEMLGRAELRGSVFAQAAGTGSQRGKRQPGNAPKASESVDGWNQFPFEALVTRFQAKFCSYIEVEGGVAMNDALSENCFVTIVCILNRIPIFIVGKPGSSKTLAIQIIGNNLLGEQSPKKFWRRFPAVHIVQYQCSPLSTALAIKTQFELAVSYQKHAENTICLLLLDEVGLAEHSPDMPLKALHSILVDPPVAVVGLSNWVLDPAKMNRAVLLQRPDASEDDLVLTAQRIIGPHDVGAAPSAQIATSPSEGAALTRSISASRRLTKWLGPLAQAYRTVYTQQQGRDFVGMRDYYQLVKLLRSKMQLAASACDADLSPWLLTKALCRNFGGKLQLLRKIITVFYRHCFDAQPPEVLPDPLTLIKENLLDTQARHLMVLTRNGSALSLMLGCGLLDITTPVLIGSSWQDDQTELHLVGQIQKVKQAMASGSTVVLHDCDNIYESLYDVLNQRYVTKTDKAGRQRRMLRLAIGTRSQLCPVATGFRIIVIVDSTRAYRDLDLPLLNRFEKQLLIPTALLGTNMQALASRLTEWADAVVDESGLASRDAVFCGMHADTIPSLVLTALHFDDSLALGGDGTIDDTVAPLCALLAQLAQPIAAFRSQRLRDAAPDYFRDHGDFTAALGCLLQSADERRKDVSAVVLTASPSSDFDSTWVSALDTFEILSPTMIHLAAMSSERSVEERVSEFFSSCSTTVDDNRILIVQCDPLLTPPAVIGHAQHIIEQQRREVAVARHVVFVVHLPPAIKSRERQFSVAFRPGWGLFFVDDLRPDNRDVGSGGSTLAMLQTSAYTLVKAGRLSLSDVLSRNFQSVLASAAPPPLDAAGIAGNGHTFAQRIRLMRKLIVSTSFVTAVAGVAEAVLKHDDALSYGPESVSAGLHRHIELVATEQTRGGSMRQSLEMALDLVAIQAITVAISAMDVNFNLATISACSLESWISLARCPTMLDSDAIAKRTPLQSVSHGLTIENTGRHGPLLARYPWSWRLANMLEATRRHSHGEQDPVALLSSIASRMLGPVASATIAILDPMDYLHDFVHSFAPLYPGLEPDQQLRIYRIVAAATRVDGLSSPAAIHATVNSYGNLERLFYLCSIYSRDRVLGDKVLDSITDAETQRRVEQYTHSDLSVACQQRLAHCDSAAAHAILRHFWQILEQSSTDSAMAIHWLEMLNEATNDIEGIVENVVQQLAGHSEDLQKSWNGMRIMCLFLEEHSFQQTSQMEALAEAARRESDGLEDRQQEKLQPFTFETFFLGRQRVVVEITTSFNVWRCSVSSPSKESHSDTRELLHSWPHGSYHLQKLKRSSGFSVRLVVEGDTASTPAVQYVFTEKTKVTKNRTFLSRGRSPAMLTEVPGVCYAIDMWTRHCERFPELSGCPEPESEHGSPAHPIGFDISELIGVANCIDITTLSGFVALKETLARTTVKTVQVHTLRRYIHDIVLVSSHDVTLELLTGLGDVVCGRDPELMDLSLRRSILRCIMFTSSDSVVQCLRNPPTIAAVQLLLHDIEDHTAGSTAVVARMGADETAPLVRQSSLSDQAKQAIVALAHHYSLDFDNMFAVLDSDSSGHVSASNLWQGLTALGYDISVAQLDAIIVAAGGANNLDVKGLRQLVSTLAEVQQLRAELQAGHSDDERFVDVQAAHLAIWGSWDPDCLQYVTAVAQVRRAIYCHAQRLVRMEVAPVSPGLALALDTPDGAMFAVKCMAYLGGLDAIASVLTLPSEQLAWLPVDRAAPIPDTSLVDPFPFLDTQQYSEFLVCVRSLTTSSSSKHLTRLDEMLSRGRTLDCQCLLGAAFTVGVVECALGPGFERLQAYLGQWASRRPRDEAIFSWFAARCPLTDAASATGNEHTLVAQQQVVAHAAIRVLAKGGWLHAIMCAPHLLIDCHSLLPTMPDDEMAAVTQGMGVVGWYKCPNGHPYSVGNCTWPMETARCPVPGCGKPIGGDNHKAVKGVTRLDRDAMLSEACQPGYIAAATTGETAEQTNRSMSPLSLRVLRLLIHGFLEIALLTPNGKSMAGYRASSAADLIRGVTKERRLKGSASSTATVAVARATIVHRRTEDWVALQDKTKLTDGSLTLALHLVLNGYFSAPARPVDRAARRTTMPSEEPAQLASIANRNAWEHWFQSIVEEVFLPRTPGVRLSDRLADAKQELQATGTTTALRAAFGPNWAALYEQDPANTMATEGGIPDSHLQARMGAIMWRFRTTVTYEHFRREFELRGDNSTRYRFLAGFLQHEARLPLVKYLADILEWHALLFGVFAARPLSREEASELSNDAVVDMLPELRRAAGKATLSHFIVAFNEAFPHVRYLYECQENPFVRDSGDGTVVVDLTGTKSGRGLDSIMSASTPVAFSLPNQVQGATDAQGLCTIRLLELLQTTHNDLLQGLERESSERAVSEDRGFKPMPSAPRQAHEARQERVVDMTDSFTAAGQPHKRSSKYAGYSDLSNLAVAPGLQTRVPPAPVEDDATEQTVPSTHPSSSTGLTVLVYEDDRLGQLLCKIVTLLM
jgi:hypothetical protein